MAHPLRKTRERLGRAIASNGFLSRAAVRIGCDEHILIRILESELLPMRLRQNEAVFLTFRAMLTDDSLLQRLLGDPQFADTILLRKEFVSYALGNHSALKQAESHPAVIDSVKNNRGVWRGLTADRDFLDHIATPGLVKRLFLQNERLLEDLLGDDEFLNRVLGHELAIDRLLADDRLLERVVSHPEVLNRLIGDHQQLAALLGKKETFDAILRNGEFLLRLLSAEAAFQKLTTDDTLLTKTLGNQRVFDKLMSDAPTLVRVLSHGRAFQTLLADDTLLTKLLGHERVFEKTLADQVILGRILSHGRTIETIARTPDVLRRLNSLESVIQHTAHNDSLFERWASNSDIRDAFRRSPRMLLNIANHGVAIEALSAQPDFIALAQASDRFVHGFLRGRGTTKRLLADSPDSDRVRAIQAFRDTWQRIAPVVNTNRPQFAELLEETAWKLNRPRDVREALLRVIAKDKVAMLAHGEMRYTDDFSLWTLIHEILLNEEYYFESDSESPYVLDCGANFGMAIYYFKTLYPGARITAFEPVPALRKLSEENAKRNEFADVEVLPYALSGDEGEAVFYVSEEYPLANTLTKRRHEMGDTLSEIKVEKRTLSNYLDRPVDFLKLDIEGAEDAVLEESRNQLKRVRSLFIEYHHGAGMEEGRLVKILGILEGAGFDYHLQKAFNFGESAGPRPITHVQDPYSLIIWGRNRNWESAN